METLQTRGKGGIDSGDGYGGGGGLRGGGGGMFEVPQSRDVCDMHIGAETRLVPSVIKTLVGRHTLVAACGRGHTVVFTAKAGGRNNKVTAAQEREMEEDQRKLDLATKTRQKKVEGEREKWLAAAKARRAERQRLTDAALTRHKTTSQSMGMLCVFVCVYVFKL